MARLDMKGSVLGVVVTVLLFVVVVFWVTVRVLLMVLAGEDQVGWLGASIVMRC